MLRANHQDCGRHGGYQHYHSNCDLASPTHICLRFATLIASLLLSNHEMILAFQLENEERKQLLSSLPFDSFLRISVHFRDETHSRNREKLSAPNAVRSTIAFHEFCYYVNLTLGILGRPKHTTRRKPKSIGGNPALWRMNSYPVIY
jgi:hypothetical protein